MSSAAYCTGSDTEWCTGVFTFNDTDNDVTKLSGGDYIMTFLGYVAHRGILWTAVLSTVGCENRLKEYGEN